MLRSLLVNFLFLVSGCVASEIQRPVHLDPSNPDAPEAKPILQSNVFRQSEMQGSGTPDTDEHSHGESSAHSAHEKIGPGAPQPPARTPSDAEEDPHHHHQHQKSHEGRHP